jgi:ADP-heptose:LPS heptosyltransferase
MTIRMPAGILRRSTSPRRLRRWLWLLRDVLFLSADSVVILWAGLAAARPAADARPKLVIVAAHGLGDLVLLHGSLDELLRPYRRAGWHITLVCLTTALGYAETYIGADAVVAVDRIGMRRDLRARLRVINHLARAGFAAAIQPNYNRELIIEDALMRATRAAERTGSSGTPQFISARQRRIGDRWYTRLVPASERLMHDLERNAEFMHSLSSAAGGIVRPLIAPPAHAPIVVKPPYLLFAVGASSPLKMWPVHNFVWLARALAERGAPKPVFCAGSTDWVDKIALEQLALAGSTDLLGRTTLTELIALISQAQLVITNDSGAVHLAAALAVPVVCIAGGGIVGRYVPYPAADAADTYPVTVMVDEPMDCFDCGWRCRFDLREGAPAPCVERVRRERVLTAVVDQLGRSAGSHGRGREPPALSTSP